MKSAAYDALVDTVCDQEPRYGFLCAMDLPKLNAEETAVVCEKYPEDIDLAVRESLSVTPFLEDIRTADVCRLGLRYMTAIAEAAREVLWPDVQEKCARREQDDADEYAEAHPESPEGRHGVASLFSSR